MSKKKRYIYSFKIILRFQYYLVLFQFKSEGNFGIAKPKQGELPLTQKVKNTVNKKKSLASHSRVQTASKEIQTFHLQQKYQKLLIILFISIALIFLGVKSLRMQSPRDA